MANFTLQMLNTLEAAIATGTTSVYYGDKRVEYRSLDEMIRIRNIMKEELGLGSTNSTVRVGEFDKDLHKPCGNIEGLDNDGSWGPWS